MTSWNPTLYRGWFVVATSRQLDRPDGKRDGKPLGITLLDRRVVLARLPSGELLALDDCCPHRHVPLSIGRVTDAGVQCGYHGWTFGADGRCTALPGLPAAACKPTVRVGTWQAVEHDGLIWLRAASSAPAASSAAQDDTHAQPPLPGFLTRLPASSGRFLWDATWQARAFDALENFLDPLHTHFVHPGLVRRDGGRRSSIATLTRANGVLRIDYDGQQQQTGLLYRLFESPRTGECAHFDATAPGSAQIEYRYANGSALYFTLHFSPQSERCTRVFGTLHVENRWAPAWVVRTFVWPFLRRVARQDQAIVEAQADNSAHFGRSTGLSSELDLVGPSLAAVWLPQPALPSASQSSSQSPPTHAAGNETRRIEIML